MFIRNLYTSFLTISFLAMPVIAQPLTRNATPQPQTFTTGFLGLSIGQNYMLSVLNLNPVSTVTTGNCNVDLQIVDTVGNVVVHKLVTNFTPQTGAFLVGNQVTTLQGALTNHVPVRAAVVVNPPSPTATALQPAHCDVMVTFEIIDPNGSTVASTTDARPVGLLPSSPGR